MAEFVKVAKVGEIAPGGCKLVEAGGRNIALFHVNGAYYATDDACTHQGGPLSEGYVSGKEVTCPWHAAVFDVTTGEVLAPPAAHDVARYAVRVTGEDVEVEV
jgi:nitrite reductase/ring-hydroxylating ferredoxin subunit